MKKILCVIYNYYPLIGGAEKQAFIINKKYLQNNIRVDILTVRNQFSDNYKEILDNQNIYRLGIPIKGIKTITAVIHSLLFYLIKKKYVLIHLHQATIFTILVGNLFKKKSNNLICKIGNSDTKFDLNFENIKLRKTLLNYLIRQIDYFIAINQLIKNQLMAFGIKKNKILSIPNTVESQIQIKNKFKFDKNSIIFLTISRLVPQKNIIFILKLAKNFEKHKFFIKGYGEQKDQLQSYITSNKLKNVFILDKNKKINYEEYDFYLSTSFVEGMSNSILEALSNGLPLFINNIPGNRIFKELNFKNQIGYFLNFEEFIPKINSLRNLEIEEYMKMRTNCFELIKKNFDIDILIKNYLNLIDEKNINHNT